VRVKRSRYAIEGRELAVQAKKRHVTLARLEGAATGLGGMLTILPDLLALAWVQSRLVFYVAAAYGYDPRDPMRPAELLVLQELYEHPADARAALDGMGRPMALAWAGGQINRQRDEALTGKLMRAVGKRTARRMLGRMVPVVASAFNAVGNERDTRALADRAIRFYGG
jgi:hypothetical protein